MENPNTGARFIKRERKAMPVIENEKTTVSTNIGVDDKSIQTKKTIFPGHEIFQKYYGMGDKEKIKMDNFTDIYSLSEIQSDKKRIEKAKENQEKPTPAGIVLENAFYDLSEKLLADEKSGNEIHSQLLSTFDDVIGSAGTRADIILEIKGNNGEVAKLLVDVTTGVTMSKLLEKRKKCINVIENGKLHSIKYLQSKIDGKRGRQENLPMVIVGMNKESLQEFCARIGEGNDLKNDYASFMFLDEIVEQLRADYVLSKSITGENSEMTKTFFKTYQAFSAILEIKNNLRPRDFEKKVVQDDTYTYLIS